jgi:hypothetical protein
MSPDNHCEARRRSAARRRIILLDALGQVEAVLWGPMVAGGEGVYRVAKAKAAELGRTVAVEWFNPKRQEWVRYRWTEPQERT